MFREPGFNGKARIVPEILGKQSWQGATEKVSLFVGFKGQENFPKQRTNFLRRRKRTSKGEQEGTRPEEMEPSQEPGVVYRGWMSSHALQDLEASSSLWKQCVAAVLLLPLVRTAKASSAEYWTKDRTSAESPGLPAFPGSLKAPRGASRAQRIRAAHSSSCQARERIFAAKDLWGFPSARPG